jgi:hypothetical protein
MNANGSQESKERHDAMANYARLYAQHRTLPFLVQTAVGLLVIAAVFGAALGAAYAARTDNIVYTICGLVLLVFACSFCVWASVPRWGGKRIWHFGTSLYGAEGHAGVKEFSQIVWPWWGYLLMPALLAGAFVHYGLTSAEWLPTRWAQPISLLYVVPFWVIMYRIQRPAVGEWMLLAPALSVVFALLVLAGAPVASDRFSMFWANLYIPMFSAQIAAMAAGHLYSRYALRRMKSLARMDPQETTHD